MFTTKSLYRFITNIGVNNRVAGISIWKSKIPLKSEFFLWQMFNNKLHVAQSLIKRVWKGDGKCCLCGIAETVDHVFFNVTWLDCWGALKEFFQTISLIP